ncbi:MAG: hypothetical protein HOP12_12810, partial [Candidatus Eisenbacteria bacterium]|nr:hypothetical protein [Candidatus Eisenbacteria bacterium]
DWESARVARIVGEPDDEPPVASAPASGSANARASKSAATTAVPRDESKRQRAESQKRDREVSRIEKDIEARETRSKVLEVQLADPELYHDAAKSREIVAEYERLRAELESLWQRLGALS